MSLPVDMDFHEDCLFYFLDCLKFVAVDRYKCSDTQPGLVPLNIGTCRGNLLAVSTLIGKVFIAHGKNLLIWNFCDLSINMKGADDGGFSDGQKPLKSEKMNEVIHATWEFESDIESLSVSKSGIFLSISDESQTSIFDLRESGVRV